VTIQLAIIPPHIQYKVTVI